MKMTKPASRNIELKPPPLRDYENSDATPNPKYTLREKITFTGYLVDNTWCYHKPKNISILQHVMPQILYIDFPLRIFSS